MDKETPENSAELQRFDTTANGSSSPDPKIFPHPALVSPSRQSFLFQPKMLPFHPGHQGFTGLAAPCLTQASVFYSTHYIPPSHLGIPPTQSGYPGTMPPLLHMQANSMRPSVLQMPNESHRKRKSSIDSLEVEISSRNSLSSVGSPDSFVVKAEETSPAQSMDYSDTSPPATPMSSCSSPAPKFPSSPQSPSLSSSSSQVSETCGICGDKATGHHYGVSSCEGCKGFFKRSVQNKKVYTCRNLTKDCPMDKRHRNRCQYCRYQKCLNAGMIKEAVREDRAPGGRHKNSQSSSHVTIKADPVPCKQRRKSLSLPSPKPSNSPPTKPLPEVIEQIMNCDLTVEFDEETCLGCKETELKEKTLAHVTQLAEYQVVRSTKWFDMLPLLCDISKVDTDLLIKNSWVELMLVNLIKQSLELEDRAMLCRKQILDFETAQVTGIGDIMQRVTQMAANFRDFKLDEVEFVCMEIIVLLNPDVVGLENQEMIEQLQDKFHTALQNYIKSKSPKDSNRFGNILLRLPELRSIGTKSLERLFMLKFTGQIHPSEVLSELLHSAKR